MGKVTNRFKGIDLIDRVPEEPWTEVRNIVQEAVTKTIPKKKKCEKAKWSSEVLQITQKRREMKGKGERERYAQVNTEYQRIAKRDKKAFFIQCKEIRKTVEWKRLEISSRKLEISRKHFMQGWAHKGQKQ